MNIPKRLSITEFLSEVPPKYSSFVLQAHGILTRDGYKSKFELKKKYGFTAQYNSLSTKGLSLQFYILGNVLYMYLYNIFFKK